MKTVLTTRLPVCFPAIYVLYGYTTFIKERTEIRQTKDKQKRNNMNKKGSNCSLQSAHPKTHTHTHTHTQIKQEHITSVCLSRPSINWSGIQHQTSSSGASEVEHMLSKCLSGLTPENTVAWQLITEMVIILFSFFQYYLTFLSVFWASYQTKISIKEKRWGVSQPHCDKRYFKPSFKSNIV